MSVDRESAVTDAFVALASGLADAADAVDFLSGLAVDTSRLLDVESTGILLADQHGVLHVIAASSEATRSLEVFQLQRDEGPCLDCYHSGAPVSVSDLRAEAPRWPSFAAAAAEAGFASVHAVPMRLRHTVLGAVGLFGSGTGALATADLRLGQALAYVAAVALVQERAAADTATINAQLRRALDSRVALEQAKGVLAQRGDLDMDQAFTVLRRYARDHDVPLTDVARAVTTRRIRSEELLIHAATANVLGRSSTPQ